MLGAILLVVCGAGYKAWEISRPTPVVTAAPAQPAANVPAVSAAVAAMPTNDTDGTDGTEDDDWEENEPETPASEPATDGDASALKGLRYRNAGSYSKFFKATVKSAPKNRVAANISRLAMLAMGRSGEFEEVIPLRLTEGKWQHADEHAWLESVSNTADKGDGFFLAVRGFLRVNGLGAEADIAGGGKDLIAGANTECGLAKQVYADALRIGVLPKDDSKRAQLHEAAGDAGVVEGYYWLGVMYAQGEGVQRHFPSALKHWELAANEQFALAELALGKHFATALDGGTIRNSGVGFDWLTRASDHGNQEARELLGQLTNP